jgi:hypothetical protein
LLRPMFSVNDKACRTHHDHKRTKVSEVQHKAQRRGPAHYGKGEKELIHHAPICDVSSTWDRRALLFTVLHPGAVYRG